MLWPVNLTIWLHPQPIDFRKQIDGLVLLVSDQLQCDPTSGQLFLFRDHSARKIKLLYWERNGFWLLYKRLEKGRLKFPRSNELVMELTQEQLGWLLSGLDYSAHQLLPSVTVSNFY